MPDQGDDALSANPFRPHHEEALKLVREKGREFIKLMAKDMRAFFAENGWKIKTNDVSRVAHKRLSEGRNCVREGVAYVNERLREFLISQEAFDVHAKVDDVLTRPKLPTSRDTERAIKHLFEMTRSHYSISTAIEGEYFGYRRSAQDGQIIRFYIRIRHIKEQSLLRFCNRYRQGDIPWLVKGSGFEVKGTFYLIGHAAEETNDATGLGMRCFALKPHARNGWFVGVLISTDDHLDPIAARIVLIPAKQHTRFEVLAGKPRDRKLMAMITDTIEVKDLDDEIQVMGAYDSAPCSAEVQALTWNGTFTTLKSYQSRLNAPWVPDYLKLFAFQTRAVRLALDTSIEMAPFVQIARHGDELIPEEAEAYKQVVESIKRRKRP